MTFKDQVESVWCRKCRRYIPVTEFRGDASDEDVIVAFRRNHLNGCEGKR